MPTIQVRPADRSDLPACAELLAARYRDHAKRLPAIEPSLLEGAGFDSLLAQRINAVGGENDARYLALLERSDEEVELITAAIAVCALLAARVDAPLEPLRRVRREAMAARNARHRVRREVRALEENV